MKNRAVLIVVTLMCLLTLPVKAANVTELNPIEKFRINVEGFEEPMTFNVTLPASYSDKKDKRYFVLFDLHPRIQPLHAGMQDWMSHNGEWPWLETLIVTPAAYHSEFANLFEQTTEKPNDLRMLSIIENQILATVDKTYRTNGFNIYSGFMGNGAIGLYALLNKPQIFDAYFIATPSIADNFLNISEDAAKNLGALSDKMRFLYINIGDHGYEKAHINAVKLFEKALTEHAPSDLDWQVDTNSKHYYMSRPVMTVLNGIEKLFNDYHSSLAADSKISQQGVEAIISYYQNLSERKYGFPVSAERSLKNLADSLLDSDPTKAFAIFDKTMQLYPESTYAFADAARAYKNSGNIEKAISLQKVAVANSKSMVEWHQNQMAKRLEEYQQLLVQNDE